ncbi:hypothetical protein, partial [Enterocloster bolteae]|uniref:hypothetical protein n=1 Tax=Enterocloster bolteae TaxID=208479 RepID=UPI00321F79B0
KQQAKQIKAINRQYGRQQARQQNQLTKLCPLAGFVVIFLAVFYFSLLFTFSVIDLVYICFLLLYSPCFASKSAPRQSTITLPKIQASYPSPYPQSVTPQSLIYFAEGHRMRWNI